MQRGIRRCYLEMKKEREELMRNQSQQNLNIKELKESFPIRQNTYF